MPTPNGSLHLGHIAGPYLKMDVLARHLRRDGHTAIISSGSDVWETHVLPKARTLGLTPEQVCEKFHREIGESLKALDIEYDFYINPLDEPYRKRLADICKAVIDTNKGRENLRLVRERVPYSKKFETPITGSFIAGTCPYCGDDDAGGFHCETCGAEISPEQMADVRSEPPDEYLEWREYNSVFLNVGDPAPVLRKLEECCSNPALIDIAKKHLERNERLVRLTHPGKWGIPVAYDGASESSMIFSFPALFSLSLLCAEVGREAIGEQSPFDPGSDVTLISAFGFDNTVPFFLGVLGQAVCGARWKPFDHYLTNYFFTLDGEKFSTSRGHAIWAKDATERLEASPDIIRLYTVISNPERAPSNFSTSEFVMMRDDFTSRFSALIESAAKAKKVAQDHSLKLRLMILLNKQRVSLNPSTFDMAASANPLWDWLKYGEENEANEYWVRGFALLAYPIMPRISRKLWHETGALGDPTIDGFDAPYPSASPTLLEKCTA